MNFCKIYKKLSDFDGKWMNDQGQRFEVRGGMVLANINGRKIEQKMLVDEEQCIFILEEPNGSPNLWSMPMNSEPVWSDGSKPIKWVRVETQNIPDGEAGGNHAPIEAVSDFDGKWKNDYGQEFEIKDGTISMKHKGEIVKDTITFDETKEVFKLAGNTWTMPLKGDTLWSDGVWSVKWTRIEEEDNWDTPTKLRRPTRRSVYTQAKQKEPPSGPSSIPLKPGPGNRIEYFLQCERDSSANKFAQFVDPGLNNNPNKEAVMESLKYAELQRRYTSMHQD